jgi:hypothetical protein
MIFIDKKLDIQFTNIGFVIIPNFLDRKTIDFLKNYHIEFDNFIDTGFKTSVWSSNSFYRKQTYELLKPIYEEKLKNILINHRGIMGNYMIKEPSKKSFIDIHADWSFTDETKYTAINAWIPLVDTTIENGCLRILPYSHKLNYPYRGRGIPHQFEGVKDYMQSLSTPIEVKAGDLVLFNVKCIHFSLNNLSSVYRPAVSMVMLPQEATVFHYTYYDENYIRKIHINDPYFFSNYNAFEEIEKQEKDELISFKRVQKGKDFFNIVYSIARYPDTLKSQCYSLLKRYRQPL